MIKVNGQDYFGKKVNVSMGKISIDGKEIDVGKENKDHLGNTIPISIGGYIEELHIDNSESINIEIAGNVVIDHSKVSIISADDVKSYNSTNNISIVNGDLICNDDQQITLQTRFNQSIRMEHRSFHRRPVCDNDSIPTGYSGGYGW